MRLKYKALIICAFTLRLVVDIKYHSISEVNITAKLLSKKNLTIYC